MARGLDIGIFDSYPNLPDSHLGFQARRSTYVRNADDSSQLSTPGTFPQQYEMHCECYSDVDFETGPQVQHGRPQQSSSWFDVAPRRNSAIFGEPSQQLHFFLVCTAHQGQPLHLHRHSHKLRAPRYLSAQSGAQVLRVPLGHHQSLHERLRRHLPTGSSCLIQYRAYLDREDRFPSIELEYAGAFSEIFEPATVILGSRPNFVR